MAESQLRNYRGNCHCGKFIFEIQLTEIKGYEECNCSICQMKGYAWVMPSESHFRFIKGSMNELKAYTFGNRYFTHLFCSDCGTAVMGNCPQLTPPLYINARAIQGLDLWSLNVKTFDGKALPPPYQPPVYDGPEPSVEVENGKIYHGNCHCGAVRLAVKVKPLETWDTLSDGEFRVIECNCSICVRGAYVWCYPHKNQSVVLGRENISYRIFNGMTERKAFCKHCGVPLFNESNPLSDEEIAGLSDRARTWRAASIDSRNINLRILQGFDVKTLKTQHLDGFSEIPGDYVDP